MFNILKTYIIPGFIIAICFGSACEREVNLGFPAEKNKPLDTMSPDGLNSDAGKGNDTDSGTDSERDSVALNVTSRDVFDGAANMNSESNSIKAAVSIVGKC